MHWQVATAVRDNNAQDNSAFTVNACGKTGAGHQSPKKVTCKACKPLIEHPRTPEQVAALLYNRVVTDTEKSDFWVSLQCNGCDCSPLDCSMFTYDPQWVSIGQIITLLGHVAYDHAFGTELVYSRHEAPFPVYSLNFALGKTAGTEHEENWRVRTGLVAEPEKV